MARPLTNKQPNNDTIRDVIIIYKIETINSAEYCRDFATVWDGVCIDVWVGLCRTIIGLYVAICIKPESDMAETCFELQIRY